MKYSVIAIEREYASGGREIGQLVAQQLNIPNYGSEVLRDAAKRLGLSADYVESMDESAPNSLLYSLAILGQMSIIGVSSSSKEQALQAEEKKVIRELADQGNCVIIGRCAGAILRDRKNVLRVFIHSGTENRRKRAVEQYGAEEQQIDVILKKHDKRRANYYSFYSGQKWDDKSAYHLMLDSGRLGIQRCADIIVAAAK